MKADDVLPRGRESVTLRRPGMVVRVDRHHTHRETWSYTFDHNMTTDDMLDALELEDWEVVDG